MQEATPGRPWPPPITQADSGAPPLSPDEALKTFSMPPGYRLELVASEPLIEAPVAIDWDPQGRLWVVEMPGYMRTVDGGNEHDPIGRVVVLEDTNHDGKMDKRTVFADGLVLARAIKVLDRGVLVGEPPNAWLMRDTNGDLRMDEKTLVTDQYGKRDADPQNNANGFFWALDNRLYTAGQVDIFLHPERGRFAVEKTLLRGEWGVSQDDAGRIFRNTNSSAVHVDLVPTPYYARNRNLLRSRGSYEAISAADETLDTVWPIRPNPGTNRAYQAGIDRPDGTLASYTAVCSPLVYRGDRLPADLRGNLFVAEPAANLVSRIVLGDDGHSLTAKRAYPRAEFLASTDERFRPVFLSNAPDGTLYVVDLYRGILEHRNSLTIYLRNHVLSHNLTEPTSYGRIYRVMHDTTRRDLSSDLAQASPQQLVRLLAHPNGWRRDTAQRLLVERADRLRGRPTVVASLTKLAGSAPDWRTRLHALWTLDGMRAADSTAVMAAMHDPSRDVRAAAVRIAERWLGAADTPLRATVLKLMDDPDWSVRAQVAASLGALPSGAREQAVAEMLDRHADDPVVMDAALSGVPDGEPAVLAALLAAPGNATPQREAALTMVAAISVRASNEAAVRGVIDAVGDAARPQWQRSALLRGAEVALLGAPMPGSAPRRVEAAPASLPCPTCSGGRAGPGGAYAFSRPPAEVQAAYGGANGGEPTQFDASRGGPGIRLTREPEPLLRMVNDGGDFAPRAATVLARLEWPGKPGSAAPAAALTAVQEQTFQQGREVYMTICQACHQPNGRGQDRVAPSLVGSALALAPHGIPARILLNGKEGTIGLMPSIGSVLTDEQIAGVLTYIRREWGQTGSPVTADEVKAVRAQTTGRSQPWTNSELLALMAAGQGGQP